jgi:hypothetical protein
MTAVAEVLRVGPAGAQRNLFAKYCRARGRICLPPAPVDGLAEPFGL